MCSAVGAGQESSVLLALSSSCPLHLMDHPSCACAADLSGGNLCPASLLLGLLLQEVSNYPLPCFTGMMLVSFPGSGACLSFWEQTLFLFLLTWVTYRFCCLNPCSISEISVVSGSGVFTISSPEAHPKDQGLTFLHILLFGEDRKGAFSQVLQLLFLWASEEAWSSWMPFLSICETIRSRHWSFAVRRGIAKAFFHPVLQHLCSPWMEF